RDAGRRFRRWRQVPLSLSLSAALQPAARQLVARIVMPAWGRALACAAVVLCALTVGSREALSPGGPHVGVGRTIVVVDFEADEPVDQRVLGDLVPLRVGKPLTREDLDEAQRLLVWKDVWSIVDPEFVREPGGVRVVYHLTIKRTVSSVKVR